MKLDENVLLAAMHEYRRCSMDQARGIVSEYLRQLDAKEQREGDAELAEDWLNPNLIRHESGCEWCDEAREAWERLNPKAPPA